MSSQAPIAVQQPRPADELLGLATGYMVSASLNVVAKLKIADLLSAGPRPVSELATALECRKMPSIESCGPWPVWVCLAKSACAPSR